MALHWRLKRENEYFMAIELKKLFPELKNCYTEDIERRLTGSSFEFYKEEKTNTSAWIRISLPLVVIVMLILALFTPFNYMITGKWGYKWVWLTNWIRSFGL